MGRRWAEQERYPSTSSKDLLLSIFRVAELAFLHSSYSHYAHVAVVKSAVFTNCLNLTEYINTHQSLPEAATNCMTTQAKTAD